MRTVDSMGWTAAQLPSLSGSRAVVTGANSGIGLETALELARHGAAVTLACRDLDKAAAARRRILAQVAGAAVDVQLLDLASLASVRAFAGRWDGPLHLLVNNAGVMAPPRRAETTDGFERQMGTNHLGHFALTGLLLPSLLAAPARVVTVSSIAHRSARLNLDDPQSVVGYSPQVAYGNAKLANLLFALELQRRAASHGTDLTSTAAHPGLATTGLVTNPEGLAGNPLARLLAPVVIRVIGQSAAAGARCSLFAAVNAEPGSYTGPARLRETRGAPGPAEVSPAAADEATAARLWELSAELTGVEYAWPA